MNFFQIVNKVWGDEYITDAELELLLQWLLSRAGQKQFEDGIEENWEVFRNERVYDYDETLRKIHARKNEQERFRRRSFLRRSRWAAAAAIAAAAIITFFMFPEKDAPQFIVYDGVFGSPNKAVLTLSDGSSIVMDDYAGDFVEENGAMIKIAQGELEYNESPEDNRAVAFHEIFIPVSSEYKLTLSDGSVVWLNSDTRLRYPMNFPHDERRVILIGGEAYFEVAQDASRPFIVEADGQSITVLGTRFNIFAYPTENQVITTLAEGSVRITADGGGETLLAPGQEARLDKATGQMSVRTADIGQTLAWKDGFIVVEDQTLEQVMQKLSRWYGVEYRIVSDVPRNIVFRGIIPKYELGNTLARLEKISNLKIRMDGNVIDVRK